MFPVFYKDEKEFRERKEGKKEKGVLQVTKIKNNKEINKTNQKKNKTKNKTQKTKHKKQKTKKNNKKKTTKKTTTKKTTKKTKKKQQKKKTMISIKSQQKHIINFLKFRISRIQLYQWPILFPQCIRLFFFFEKEED